MASLMIPAPTVPTPQPVRHRTAEISPCDRYRYRLTREWDDARPPATFVMLNPSTADADQDDATVRKCIRYAQRWACGSLVVVNLFAWRSTDPRRLPTGPEAVGPDNDGWLSQAALDALDSGGPLVAAWGAHSTRQPRSGGSELPGLEVLTVEQRVADVLTLPGMGRLTALSVTRDGHPGHPLYLRSEARLVAWSPRVGC
ncbi:DUF1643 domain-containing protein [Streptomyces sp. NPDC014623]|uniref:DUF1643 domain-containing protein n=1 Tax=Streptomyces sp. NPDC014623 TaxID=3364875 RepID=UPI0036FFD941